MLCAAVSHSGNQLNNASLLSLVVNDAILEQHSSDGGGIEAMASGGAIVGSIYPEWNATSEMNRFVLHSTSPCTVNG